jgi:hypothetical protein
MGEELTDDAEVLYRQVHPSFYENGEPSSQTFTPTDKDDGKLSLDRSSLVTAMESFQRFTGAGFSSCAVYGLSVGEFAAEQIRCASDPLEETATQKANHAHAIADYSVFSVSSRKIKAKRLKRAAVARGRLHPL